MAVKILDVTMGHCGMQKEVAKLFNIKGRITNLDIRPLMGNGRRPDIVADSRNLPFLKGAFDIVFFDPPFSFHGGKSIGSGDYSRFYTTYGLNLYHSRAELADYLEKSFQEIRRVLSKRGYCLFKWSESRIRLDFALDLAEGFYIRRKFRRPSKHVGTKTGTSTWYTFLVKGAGLLHGS